MASDLVLTLMRMTLWGSLAAGLVCSLRTPVRRAAGAQQVCTLWLVVPLAMLGAVLPPVFSGGPTSSLEAGAQAIGAWLDDRDAGPALLAVWALGALVSALRIAYGFAHFRREARAGRAGPAVLGVIAPRLIMPADFAQRFTAEEAELIRAHERAHINRGDARIAVVALALQTLNWFNPVLHLAGRMMRLDQELACDAAVLGQHPDQRRAYAGALIAAQSSGAVSPLGCRWQAESAAALAARLTLILQPCPRPNRQILVTFAIGSLCISLFAGAWLTQPPYRPPILIFLDMTGPR